MTPVVEPTEILPPPGTGALVEAGASMMELAMATTIESEHQYQDAAALLTRVARVERQIVDAFAEPKKKAFEAHRAICNLEAQLLGVPQEATRIIKEKGRNYLTEADRQRREREAEIQRQLREQEERDRIAAAEHAQAHGASEAEIDGILETPAPTPVVELPKPQATGVTQRTRWRFSIYDRSKIHSAYMAVDEKKIAAAVRSLGKDAESAVGGIRVFAELDMVRR